MPVKLFQGEPFTFRRSGLYSAVMQSRVRDCGVLVSVLLWVGTVGAIVRSFIACDALFRFGKSGTIAVGCTLGHFVYRAHDGGIVRGAPPQWVPFSWPIPMRTWTNGINRPWAFLGFSYQHGPPRRHGTTYGPEGPLQYGSGRHRLVVPMWPLLIAFGVLPARWLVGSV